MTTFGAGAIYTHSFGTYDKNLKCKDCKNYNNERCRLDNKIITENTFQCKRKKDKPLIKQTPKNAKEILNLIDQEIRQEESDEIFGHLFG